jgi:hypothetical protein
MTTRCSISHGYTWDPVPTHYNGGRCWWHVGSGATRYNFAFEGFFSALLIGVGAPFTAVATYARLTAARRAEERASLGGVGVPMGTYPVGTFYSTFYPAAVGTYPVGTHAPPLPPPPPTMGYPLAAHPLSQHAPAAQAMATEAAGAGVGTGTGTGRGPGTGRGTGTGTDDVKVSVQV